jgi:hypothetical protein
MMEAYIHSPIHFHDAMLNYLNTGTILTFLFYLYLFMAYLMILFLIQMISVEW